MVSIPSSLLIYLTGLPSSYIASAASSEYLLSSVCCVEATESLSVSLFGSLLSYSSDTNKTSVVWSDIFSSSITYFAISSIRSTSSFSLSKSLF